jgi:hypothetical protein
VIMVENISKNQRLLLSIIYSRRSRFEISRTGKTKKVPKGKMGAVVNPGDLDCHCFLNLYS